MRDRRLVDAEPLQLGEGAAADGMRLGHVAIDARAAADSGTRARRRPTAACGCEIAVERLGQRGRSRRRRAPPAGRWPRPASGPANVRGLGRRGFGHATSMMDD